MNGIIKNGQLELSPYSENAKNAWAAAREKRHENIDDGDGHEQSVHDVPSGIEVSVGAVEHADGQDFQQHFDGKDKGEDIVGQGKEGTLERVGRNERPFHGQRDAIQSDEKQDRMVEPTLSHQVTTRLPDAADSSPRKLE